MVIGWKDPKRFSKLPSRNHYTMMFLEKQTGADDARLFVSLRNNAGDQEFAL